MGFEIKKIVQSYFQMNRKLQINYKIPILVISKDNNHALERVLKAHNRILMTKTRNDLDNLLVPILQIRYKFHNDQNPCEFQLFLLHPWYLCRIQLLSH